MKKLALLVFLLAGTCAIVAQTPPSVSLSIEQGQAAPGEDICLSVTVSDFTDIQGMQWGLSWDPSVLEFQQLTNFNLRDLDLPDFNVGAAPEGAIRLSWIPLQAPFTLSLPDETVIFDICFRVKATAANGFSAVSFDNELITTEIYVDPALYDYPVVDLPQMRAGGVQVGTAGGFTLNAGIGIDENCGGNAATIDLTPLNGRPPYTYLWSGPNNFSADQASLSGLNPGVYQVTVTDADGQMATGYFPISIHGSPDPLPNFLLNATVTESSCFGNTGSIVLAPNPAGQYSYSWNTGDTTSTIDSLAAGTYHLEMTNAQGCVQSFSFTVTQEEVFSDLIILRDSLSCINGRAEIGIIAPEGVNYRYRWGFGASSNTITVSRADVYELTVTSSSGCTQDYAFFVGEPELDLRFSRIDGNLGCSDTSVTIGLSMEQATGGLQFRWEDGTTTSQRTVDQPGTYQLSVTQANCSRDFTFRVEQLDDGPFFYQRVEQPFSCAQATARVGVDVSNDLNYTYQWENRPDTTGVINVANPGTYTVTILNGRCRTEEIFTVVPFTEPDLSFGQRLDDQLSCDPADTARIGLRATANSTYTYLWNTGDTDDVIPVVDTGLYTVTVTEGICSDTFSFQVPLNAEKGYDILRDDITCADPVAQIGITDAPDYWRLEGASSAGDQQAIQVDTPGLYTLMVTGGDRCQFSESIEVFTISNPSAYTRLAEDLNCTGSDTVAIGLIPNPDFGESLTYTWNTGQADSVILVSTSGTYQLSVTGNGNCFERYQFEVGDQSDVIAYERVDNQLNCRDAEVTIGVSNIQPNRLTYAWSNNDTTATTNISVAGTYQLTITDPATQCQRIETFAQSPPSIQQARIEGECATADLCGGRATYTATVSDGSAPFIYRWNTGQTDTLSGPATITLGHLANVAVTVTDATGCQVVLEEEAIPCTPLNEFKARMYFDCTEAPEAPDGLLNAEVLSGGLPPYQYEWSTGITDTSYFRSSIPFEAGVGTYNVTVTDATGRQQALTFADTERYSCGQQQSNTLTYLAPHLTVAPDSSFRYVIRATNYAGVDRSIYTIDWDPCIVQADTLRLFLAEGDQEFSDLIPLEGTFEVAVGPYDPQQNSDTITIAEIVFTPQKTGVSPFIFSINEPTTDNQGNPLPIRPVHGSITVADADQLVQAGDADNDGFVDQYDVLPLGFALNQTGPDRRRELRSGSEFGYVWGQATPARGINYRHLDGNGNGRITRKDVATIDRNWQTKQRHSDHTPGAPPLTITDTVLQQNTTNTVSLTLGNANMPVTNAYGLAFTLQYDAAQIDPQSIMVAFDSSWLVHSGDLTYMHHVPEEQRIYLALSGVNGEPRTGSGPIAQLSFQLTPEAVDTTTVQFLDALLLSDREEPLPLSIGSTVLDIDAVNAQRNPALDEQISLFPNPAQEVVMTQVPLDVVVQHLQIRDVNGRVVAANNSRSAISVRHLPEGIYIMYIKTNAGLAIKKIAVSSR